MKAIQQNCAILILLFSGISYKIPFQTDDFLIPSSIGLTHFRLNFVA